MICVDIDADTPTEAYGKLYEAMGKVEKENKDIQWESSDEWYDEDGEPLTEKSAQLARKRYFATRGGHERSQEGAVCTEEDGGALEQKVPHRD